MVTSYTIMSKSDSLIGGICIENTYRIKAGLNILAKGIGGHKVNKSGTSVISDYPFMFSFKLQQV